LNLDRQLDAIQRWIDWGTAQVKAYNLSAKQRIVDEVQARKARLLANRNMQEGLGFPMRERSDAATYSVPIKRKKIVPTKTTVPAKPFRPEPARAEAHYEAALEVLRNQRNALERAPGTSADSSEAPNTANDRADQLAPSAAWADGLSLRKPLVPGLLL
jgi:hypothetical protein